MTEEKKLKPWQALGFLLMLAILMQLVLLNKPNGVPITPIEAKPTTTLPFCSNIIAVNCCWQESNTLQCFGTASGNTLQFCLPPHASAACVVNKTG